VKKRDLTQRFFCHHEGTAQIACEGTALGRVSAAQQSEIDQKVGAE